MSTIKVDKLQGTSGSATALTLNGAASTFNGVHTVGNNAIYTSDGGAVTQNVTDAMIKSWSSQVDQAALDSFNVSSMTDVSAGITEDNFTNVFADAKYASVGSSGGNAAVRTFCSTNWYEASMWTTAKSRTGSLSEASGAYLDSDAFVIRCGNLA